MRDVGQRVGKRGFFGLELLGRAREARDHLGNLAAKDGNITLMAVRKRHAPPAVQHLVHFGGKARDLAVTSP